MPRLTDEIINQRVRTALSQLKQAAIRQMVSPETFESLIQRAQQRRGAKQAKPKIKPSPEQRADLTARALPSRREEAERW